MLQVRSASFHSWGKSLSMVGSTAPLTKPGSPLRGCSLSELVIHPLILAGSRCHTDSYVMCQSSTSTTQVPSLLHRSMEHSIVQCWELFHHWGAMHNLWLMPWWSSTPCLRYEETKDDETMNYVLYSVLLYLHLSTTTWLFLYFIWLENVFHSSSNLE